MKVDMPFNQETKLEPYNKTLIKTALLNFESLL